MKKMNVKKKIKLLNFSMLKKYKLDNIDLDNIENTCCSNESCKQKLKLDWPTSQIGVEYKPPKEITNLN